jgi:hypothetical protein
VAALWRKADRSAQFLKLASFQGQASRTGRVMGRRRLCRLTDADPRTPNHVVVRPHVRVVPAEVLELLWGHVRRIPADDHQAPGSVHPQSVVQEKALLVCRISEVARVFVDLR